MIRNFSAADKRGTRGFNLILSVFNPRHLRLSAAKY